jgi:hypothetical protein
LLTAVSVADATEKSRDILPRSGNADGFDACREQKEATSCFFVGGSGNAEQCRRGIYGLCGSAAFRRLRMRRGRGIIIAS